MKKLITFAIMTILPASFVHAGSLAKGSTRLGISHQPNTCASYAPHYTHYKKVQTVYKSTPGRVLSHYRRPYYHYADYRTHYYRKPYYRKTYHKKRYYHSPRIIIL